MASPAPVGPPAKDTKPNFNAWFKAFGAPKVILPTGKRKADFVPRDSPDDPSEDIPDVPPPTPGRSLGNSNISVQLRTTNKCGQFLVCSSIVFYVCLPDMNLTSLYCLYSHLTNSK